MTLNDNLLVLRETPLFSELAEDALRLIAFGVERRNILKGDTLYHQGDAAHCAYVIIYGVMDIWVQKPDQKPISLGQIKRGSLIGEIALIMPKRRQYTVKAVEDTTLMQINRDIFHRLLDEYPVITKLLYTRIRKNLDQLTSQLNQLGQKLH